MKSATTYMVFMIVGVPAYICVYLPVCVCPRGQRSTSGVSSVATHLDILTGSFRGQEFTNSESTREPSVSASAMLRAQPFATKVGSEVSPVLGTQPWASRLGDEALFLFVSQRLCLGPSQHFSCQATCLPSPRLTSYGVSTSAVRRQV